MRYHSNIARSVRGSGSRSFAVATLSTAWRTTPRSSRRSCCGSTATAVQGRRPSNS